MKAHNSDSHIFSFYYESTHKGYIDHTEDLFFRLKNILRAKPGNKYILFDRLFWYEIITIEINKQKFLYSILNSHKIINSHNTELIAFIPILHSKYLNQAMYQLGKTFVSKIYLIKTELSKKERNFSFAKLNQYIIQGAEESKNYLFPVLENKIMTISEILSSNKQILLLYEKAATNIQEYSKNYDQKNINDQSISFLCGPEEGFTKEELETLLSSKNIHPYSLHNVILKSIDTIFYTSILLSQNL